MTSPSRLRGRQSLRSQSAIGGPIAAQMRSTAAKPLGTCQSVLLLAAMHRAVPEGVRLRPYHGPDSNTSSQGLLFELISKPCSISTPVIRAGQLEQGLARFAIRSPVLDRTRRSRDTVTIGFGEERTPASVLATPGGSKSWNTDSAAEHPACRATAGQPARWPPPVRGCQRRTPPTTTTSKTTSTLLRLLSRGIFTRKAGYGSREKGSLPFWGVLRARPVSSEQLRLGR
jgi:hypothetical protein